MSFSFRMFLSNKNIRLDPGQSKYCLNDLMVLYMSFDMFLLAVESRDLSQADTRKTEKNVYFSILQIFE